MKSKVSSVRVVQRVANLSPRLMGMALIALVAAIALQPARAQDDPYKGKVAVITGSGSGLGAEMAKIAGERGMKLVLGIRPGGSKDVAEAIRKKGVEVEVVEADMSIAEQRPRVIDAAVKKFGRIDYLFNNAGFNYVATLEQMDLKQAHELFEVNYWAYLDLAQRAIPIMKKQGGGTIVNTGSMMAHMPGSAGSSQYSASKHALLALFQAVEQEVKPLNIRIKVLSPGGMRTNIAKNSVGPGAEGRRDRADNWEAPDVVAREVFEEIPKKDMVIYAGQMAKGLQRRN